MFIRKLISTETPKIKSTETPKIIKKTEIDFEDYESKENFFLMLVINIGLYWFFSQ